MAPTTTGKKRKAESTKPSKEASGKELKKPKLDKDAKSKSSIPNRKKAPVQPTKESEDSSDDDFEGFEEDGGVNAGGDSAEADSDEEGDAEENTGMHPDRAKAVTNGTSSREAHAKQRQERKERKIAKPLGDETLRTKKIWERLRRKSHVPVDERKKLVEELYGIITGRVKEFVLKHDSVRVIQTAIKYSNPEQRRMIAKELQGTYCQLAESKYAKFLIGKLLVQGDKEIRDLIVPEFYGQIRKLIKHPEASWILDDIYRGVASKQQKAFMLREWYGAEFVLFQKDNTKTLSSDLSEILAEDGGAKRKPIMRALFELTNHLIQKKQTAFTMLHDAMLQYFLNATPGTEEHTEYMELIKGDEEGDLLKNLAFTESGSRLVCLLLAYGSAKDRKQVLKTYKDTMQMMASDVYAHAVILTAYEVIDDTVLTSKSIFPELLSKDAEKQIENIILSANDLNARTTLLYLFQGRSKRLFPTSLSKDLQILAEIDTIRKTTSKKDPEIRTAELAKALSPMLLTGIATAANDLVSTSFGCQFITEVLIGATGDKSAALAAVAATAAGDPSQGPSPSDAAEEENAEAPPAHLAHNAHGGKMLKALIAGGHFDFASKKVVPVDPPLKFADILYPVIKPHVMEWATGASSFVVLNLVECEDFSAKEDLIVVLKKSKGKLEKVAKGAAAKSGAEEKKGKGAKGKGKKEEKREGGNMGAALLLEKL